MSDNSLGDVILNVKRKPLKEEYFALSVMNAKIMDAFNMALMHN